MANIMDLKKVQNHVHRNGFDLSYRHLFTAQVGELLPVMCKEILPGDKFDVDVKSFSRTLPVQTAAFTRIREYYDFYFVPTRLMWDKFSSYIVQTNNYQHAQNIISSPKLFDRHPYFRSDEMLQLLSNCVNLVPRIVDELGYSFAHRTCRLLEMLGYGSWLDTVLNYENLPNGKTEVPSIPLNPFPLMAYQKIYQDYFRYQQWEKASPYTCNLDYIFDSNSCELDLGTLGLDGDNVTLQENLTNSLFTVRYANYKKDFFTGLLPTPQFGDTAIASPLSGTASPELHFIRNDGTFPKNGNPVIGNNGTLYDAQGQIIPRANLKFTEGFNNVGISVFALRMAESLQKYREITNSGDLDYAEQLSKHWNVKTSDFQSDLCQYLGGTSSNFNINEVVNQNLTGGAQSTISGTGRSALHGHIKRQFNEHGYLLCIYHSEPVLDWQPLGVDRMCTKVDASDYAIPEFDNLGMQQVMSSELMFGWHKENQDDAGVFSFPEIKPLGYAPRYIDYKTSVDKCTGEFNTVFKDWVNPMSLRHLLDRLVNINNTNKYQLDYLFFKINPNILDSIFKDASMDTVNLSPNDQFLVGSYFDVKAVRNLSVNGLPY